jgi:hypothetical protein
MTCALEAEAGFVFREQALMDGLFAGIVHLVGDAREVGVDPGELEVVVHLVEQVAQGCGISVTGANEARQGGGQLLFDCLFENRATHDGAGREKAEEVAAGGLVQVEVRIFRAWQSDYALAKVCGAGDSRLDHFKQLKGKSCPQQIVLLGVESALDLLPGRG